MISSYIKVAYRNLMKNKFFNISNILVLGTVLAIVLHLFSYLSFEYNYDRFNKNYDRMARVRMDVDQNGHMVGYAMSLGLLGDLIKHNFPEVADYVRFSPLPDDGTFVYKKQIFREDKVFFADSTVFNIFSFPLVTGDPKKVFTAPNSLVMTEEMARKYFGSEYPIGKSIKIKGKYYTGEYVVSGIIKKVPADSHIQFDCLISNAGLLQASDNFRTGKVIDFWTYLLIRNGHTDLNDLANRINLELNKNQPMPDMKISVALQPMKDIHLYSNYDTEIEKGQNGNYRILSLLLSIGIVCLLIAYLNYINISVVRTMERSFEVGVRIVIGASTADNIRLFFTEAIFQTLFSFFFGILFYFASLPLIKSYFGFGSVYFIWHNPGPVLLFFGGLLFLNVLFSLLYSFIYSRTSLMTILKARKSKIISRRVSFRNTPIIVQFMSCVFFISFILVVMRQGSYIQTKDLGFEKENILMILQPHLDSFWQVYGKMPVFKQEVAKDPDVTGVTQAVYNPGYNNYGQYSNVSSVHNGKTTPLWIAVNGVKYNFFDTYGMKLAAGRFFSDDKEGNDVVVNESAVKLLGYDSPQEILGQGVYFYSSKGTARVIGVVKDFHQQTLQYPMRAVIFYLDDDVRHAVVVKLNGEHFQRGLEAIHRIWNNIFPENDFTYEILDQKIDNLYSNETIFRKWLVLFSFLSIWICAIGISTIIFYTYRQREKEVSVRKVFGASTSHIVGLSRPFFVLILLSTIAGLAVSYLISWRWLQSYAYRVSIGLWFILIPLAIILLFSLVSLAYAVNRASAVNPAVVLKYD